MDLTRKRHDLMLGIVPCVCCRLLTFFKLTFKTLSECQTVSTDVLLVQMLSADEKSRR